MPWMQTFSSASRIELRLVGAQHARAVGQGEPAGDDAGSIVVAADAEHADAGPGQARGLLRKELAGAPVLPLAVEQIPAISTNATCSFNARIDQVGEGGARRGADAVCRGVGVRFEPRSGLSMCRSAAWTNRKEVIAWTG